MKVNYSSIIGAAPNLKIGDIHESVGSLQTYLRRYGFLKKHAKVAENTIDLLTERAIKKYQRHRKIKPTGKLDSATRAKMSEHRCGMPDGNRLAATTVGPWDRKNLSYAIGPVTSQVNLSDIQEAIRSAFNTWALAGVGLSFEEVGLDGNPDIVLEWRDANDSDFNMVGGEIAHADFPPGFWLIVDSLPLPIHFDDSENNWVIGASFGAFDIETVALHEIGHCLGLDHSNVDGCVMNPSIPSNFTNRELQNDDLVGISNLYRSV